MKNLFVLSITIGCLVAKNAYGMPNPMPQGGNSNNLINNTGSYIGVSGNVTRNAENNSAFLPTTTRRFSEGMINFSVWPDPKKQNQGTEPNGGIILEQQQNGREAYLQKNPSRSCIDHVNNRQEPLQQNRFNSSSEFISQEINGNINGNTMFFPILRSSNNENQPINNHSNLPQQQYNHQGYFPTSEFNNFLNPAFNLTEVLQLNEQQSRIIRETRQELSNIKHQNEILVREIQDYRDREMYFFPDKIAQLQEEIISLEKCLANQQQKQCIKIDRIIALEQQNAELSKEVQYYRNGNAQGRIIQLEKQIKEQLDQIEKEKAAHEAEIKNLKEQLKNEKELNMVLNLGTESIRKLKNS